VVPKSRQVLQKVAQLLEGCGDIGQVQERLVEEGLEESAKGEK